MSQSNSQAHVLGIDTGGTYTDGVLLEYYTRRVLATHKSLTTRYDFSVGIEAVIDGIEIADPTAIKMVSISTTLATNAIAEGKGKRVALLLIGYDRELVSSFKMEGRFATPNYYYFRGGHDVYGREKEALDEAAIRRQVQTVAEEVDAIAISSYFSPLNPDHENRAHEVVRDVCDLPVVLGNQLSTQLGSVERATTAALNASLLAVLRDFVLAVRRAMARRNIDAPLMVVRGDGTLMSDEFAARTPVETIHSGPAASAIGGRFLSDLDDALVVDVGGTTTDLALIQAGEVTIGEEGASVGRYKTAVKAANLLSIGLGGDSHITMGADKRLRIGPERVIPLSYLAYQHDDVAHRLSVLGQRSWTQVAPEWLEYWVLLREPQNGREWQGAHTEQLITLLRDGPRPLARISEELGVLHAGQIAAGDLFRQEILGKAGLTPTDLMHIEGQYTPWNVDVARQAWHLFCRFHFADAEEMRAQVWRQISETIVEAIVTFLSGKRVPPPGLPDKEGLGRWFFQNSVRPFHDTLETRLRLRQPIIGIGAPAEVFLREVAKILHTDLILPRHHEVANAVGAIAGSVVITEEMLVYPRMSGEGLDVVGYYVQASDNRHEFETEVAALRCARELCRERALQNALRSGADNPQVLLEETPNGLDSYRVRARAVGSPRLQRRET
ncbi:MAG TPA: hydantoinase/oxoprolinase family protein [Candidatus Sulfomarinibacteraceae bacterium]|nr:hydantoinase/oxoprolinase family protein [Candidatus Sulfomarinibacteraceae bacterium]